MKKNNDIISTIIKYTIIFSILVFLLLSIFAKYNKSFVWINISNDGLDQHLVNLHLFKNLFTNFLKTGHINTFIWNIGYGIDMFGNLAYYIFGDFLSYFALITKSENLDTLYNILIIIRLYLVGLSFIAYGKYKKLSPNSNLIGALTYTFSTFTLFALARHPYFINPLIIFPILIISIERLIKENKKIFFITMIAIMFISSFYFAYMMSLCIMIYGIIITFSHYKNKPKKFIYLKLLSIFLYALLGIALSSFILVPTAYSFLTSTRTDKGIYLYKLSYYKNLIESLISTKNTGNWSIIGLSSIILAILPQFIKNRNKHQDILKYITILLIPLLIPFLGSLFAGLSYPNNRWTFVINFILSYIVALMLDKNYQFKLKNNIIFILIYTTIIIILNNNLNSQLIISIICGIIFTIIIKYKQKLNKLYPLTLISILTINLGYNIYYLYDSNKTGYINEFVESNALSLYDNANYQIPYLKDATDYLKTIDNSYYNTLIYPNNLYNLSIVNNYNSISYFYSIVNNNYLELATELENQELGINKEIKNFNHRTKITTLLNTKYMITTDQSYIPYGYELIKNYNNQTYIYKNKYHLSFANLYTQYINIEDFNKLTPLEKENIILEATVTNDIPTNYKSQNNIKNINYTTTNQYIENNQITITDIQNNKLILNTDNINDSEVYLYIKNIKFKPKKKSTAYNISVTINNKTITESTKDKKTNAYYFKNNDILINLGYFKNLNSNIELTFSSLGTYSFDSLEILALNFDNYSNTISNLNNSNFNITKYDNNYLEGTVNTTNNGILQFTTNYSKGWKVFVDDIEVKTFESNKYFLGINIQKGYHKIHMEYTTPYKNIGTLITITAIIIFIYIIIKERKEVKKWKK